MDGWRSDLAQLRAGMPCILAQLVRPRLVFLPCWWSARNGAWIYFHFIFVGPGLVNAPEDVRRYLIGHEYGHIYCQHICLHYLYWIGIAIASIGAAAQLLTIEALGFLLLATISLLACWPALMRRRECQADAVAATFFGRDVALRGALWLAQMRGTMSNNLSRDRLRLLGWKG